MTVGAAAKDFTGPAFYGSFVLYGHKAGSRKLGDSRKEVKGRNFIKQAFDQTKEEAVNKTIEEIGRRIDALANGNGTE